MYDGGNGSGGDGGGDNMVIVIMTLRSLSCAGVLK